MNSLLYLIVAIASNFVNGQTNSSTTVASMNVSETSTSSVLEFNNTVGISKATNSKSNYPHSSASVNGVASTKIPSSAMASSSDSVKTGISPSNMIKPTSPPVTTRGPSESSVFVQDTASVMNSNISLSTERAPTITATLSVIPSTTIPSYSVAQSTTHAMVTSNVSTTTNVTKESVQPNVTHNIQATPSAIASSTSSSDTQYVSSMIPSTAMMVTSDTATTLVNNTTAPMLNATATSTVMMKATQSAVQNMTTPPDTVNSSTSRMIISSSSPTSVPTTSTTMPRNATMPNTTIQSPTSATNASVFSSAVMPTVSLTEKMTTSFETHIRTTPVVMTSSIKGLSSSPTISSMTHPSSSHIITPGPLQIVLVRITINANCTQVPNHQSNDFKAAVQLSVSQVLNISSSKINISAVICGSIIVDMAIENVNNEDINQKLMDAVNNNQLNILYDGTQLAVTSVNILTTKPITPTVTTLSVSRDSLTRNPMSSTTIVTETLSGSPQRETTSQVLAKSSTSPVKSASDTASAMSTQAINASIFLNATMFSSAVMQTVSPTGKMTMSFETHVTTSPVENMTTHATNSSIFAKATILSSHSSAIMQTMSPTGKMPPVVNMTMSPTGKTNTSFATHVRTSPVVNMTSSIKGLSSSPAISSMAHPSSSQVITPVPPVLVRITIDADCNRVPSQSTSFKDAVRLSCSKVLNISASKIKITAVQCGSILVDMEIQNENNENITRKLEDAVNNNQLHISYNGTQLAVTSVKELTTKPTSKNDDDDDNTASIIYIVFGSVLGLAFLIALVILIVRCRRERSTGMFHLPSEENLELSGFSVQNKSYQGQGGNFYGELQPESSEHRLSGIPDESDPAPNDLAGGAEDGGGFGGAYLPAWKNLPTMDMSEVNRNDDTNDNLLLTYGKTAGEEGKDSGKTDVVTSYDNVGAV